jgi:hypothetical protein
MTTMTDTPEVAALRKLMCVLDKHPGDIASNYKINAWERELEDVTEIARTVLAAVDGRGEQTGAQADAVDAAKWRECITAEKLAPFYRASPQTIAALCDELIDRSGALLGRVRARSAAKKGRG